MRNSRKRQALENAERVAWQMYMAYVAQASEAEIHAAYEKWQEADNAITEFDNQEQENERRTK